MKVREKKASEDCHSEGMFSPIYKERGLLNIDWNARRFNCLAGWQREKKQKGAHGEKDGPCVRRSWEGKKKKETLKFRTTDAVQKKVRDSVSSSEGSIDRGRRLVEGGGGKGGKGVDKGFSQKRQLKVGLPGEKADGCED